MIAINSSDMVEVPLKEPLLGKNMFCSSNQTIEERSEEESIVGAIQRCKFFSCNAGAHRMMVSKPESPFAGFGRKGWAVEAMSAGGTM
ncbi:hypothetical protein VNO80_11790 [Phaseolus coccineus]|uniref:Uncharacterized protein n=1 Tax=Phaseolus coccineus TaxID=3886 RepID=A0AAN9NCA4_PHACN